MRILLFAAFAATALLSQTVTNKPETPFPAHKIIGNLYYVGSREFASYLITTPEGHMLINSTYEYSLPRLKSSVEKLGFKFRDIRILLTSEGHADHIGGCAKFIQQTGARLHVMNGDVEVVENGGKGDFFYKIVWPGCKVDRVLHDSDKVKLGGVELTARHTPGHTRGATTFLMKVAEQGRTYDVVIAASPNPGKGYRLVDNSKYPNITADFKKTYDLLLSLPCDVWLGAHGSHHNMAAKYARIGKGPNPYIDPQGYRDYLMRSQRAILQLITQQRMEAAR
ncbi:MAG: subclass B3 metallo-beta-lactamase [Bryobacteraceae bacterium]|nr:subclass B3 metallo-beta-lactamase [Bryobacteraceae bacterium]